MERKRDRENPTNSKRHDNQAKTKHNEPKLFTNINKRVINKSQNPHSVLVAYE